MIFVWMSKALLDKVQSKFIFSMQLFLNSTEQSSEALHYIECLFSIMGFFLSSIELESRGMTSSLNNSIAEPSPFVRVEKINTSFTDSPNRNISKWYNNISGLSQMYVIFKILKWCLESSCWLQEMSCNVRLTL